MQGIYGTFSGELPLEASLQQTLTLLRVIIIAERFSSYPRDEASSVLLFLRGE